MPKIDELMIESKKKFKKSVYRPWNYMDEIEKEGKKDKKEVIKESNSNQLEVSAPKSSLPEKKPQALTVAEKSININFHDNETALDVIFRLTGHQKVIFLFIIERCMSKGSLTSGIVKMETLVEITNTTHKMVKTSIQRLVHKGLIRRDRGKTGRGGFYIFVVSEVVRNAAIDYKRILGRDNQLEIKKESIGNLPKINKLSENEQPLAHKVALPEEWVDINIEPLKETGFTLTQLKQLYRLNITTHELVQESIYHFAFGLKNNPKFKEYSKDGKNPLNVLMGVLRKGEPWGEPSYQSPQELAQREIIERKKAERERLKQLEEDAYKLALEEWRETLSSEQLEEIAPLKQTKGDLMPEHVKISIYFKDNVWTEKKKEYLVDDTALLS